MINDLILFISSESEPCQKCISFISRANFPINTVRLDTAEAREIAKNGKFFSITKVPTLIIIMDDGQASQYIGLDKVIQVIMSLLKSNEDTQVEFINNPPPKKRDASMKISAAPEKSGNRKKKKKRGKNVDIIDENYESNPETMHIDYVDEVPIDYVQEPTIPKKNTNSRMSDTMKMAKEMERQGMERWKK